jgi:hypothetical protein
MRLSLAESGSTIPFGVPPKLPALTCEYSLPTG